MYEETLSDAYVALARDGGCWRAQPRVSHFTSLREALCWLAGVVQRFPELLYHEPAVQALSERFYTFMGAELLGGATLPVDYLLEVVVVGMAARHLAGEPEFPFALSPQLIVALLRNNEIQVPLVDVVFYRFENVRSFVTALRCSVPRALRERRMAVAKEQQRAARLHSPPVSVASYF